MNYNECYTYIKPLYAWENDSEYCNKHILPRTQYIGSEILLTNLTVKFTATRPIFFSTLASTVVCGSAL